MSSKCFKISSCLCFIIFSVGIFFMSALSPYNTDLDYNDFRKKNYSVLTFSKPEAQWDLKCYLYDLSSIKTPSLESFVRASSTEEDRELRLSGRAVYSNLTNACQLPVDVSKSNIHVNKIALITIANETVCPLAEVAVNAQKAGYSVVLYFSFSPPPFQASARQTDTQVKLLIPVLTVSKCGFYYDSWFMDADQSYVEISIPQNSDALSKMDQYFVGLICWFLLGPLITLEWLRRTKKFCCMSGGQQVDEERDTEDEEAVGETSLYSVVDETQENNNQETEDEQTTGEEQPLIIVTSYPHSNLTNTEHMTTVRRFTTLFAKIFGKFAVGCGYVIFIIAALPVGISSGGLSFFRFDENEDVNVGSFWDELYGSINLKTKVYVSNNITVREVNSVYPGLLFQFWKQVLILWWSPFEIFCFFLYSRFACKTTWTVPTNFSKLIRSNWFASNLYLLVLGGAVPYCSVNFDSSSALNSSAYFTFYNTVCTICNLLFIIILNKHKFVTRYVFYISVCMICAYAESDIAAMFYFVLNSAGSLNNIKLSAFRTAAIGLTLTLSFSSSMHIVRKLTKPQEFLFEGLGEN